MQAALPRSLRISSLARVVEPPSVPFWDKIAGRKTRMEMLMASALITGTSKGIGMETALAFARAGYQVHATMRNPSRSPALAETATREKLPLSVSALDVDSDQSVSKGIAQIQEEHGPIDVLVNNAG